MNIYEAENMPERKVDIREAKGAVAASFVYAFPPDIPLVVPGEPITKEIIDAVVSCKNDGCMIMGLSEWDISII